MKAKMEINFLAVETYLILIVIFTLSVNPNVLSWIGAKDSLKNEESHRSAMHGSRTERVNNKRLHELARNCDQTD